MTDTSSPSAPSVYHEGDPQVDLPGPTAAHCDRTRDPTSGPDGGAPTARMIDQYRDYRQYAPAVCAADPLGSVYEIVLLTPDLAQYCRFGRDDPGLKLFRDGIYAADLASLSQACRIIRQWTGRYVELVEERHGDLTRWTVLPSQVL